MATEKVEITQNKVVQNGAAGGVYGLGFLGALVYFIQTAPNFWEGVLGVLKAIVWPALLVYELLKYLKL